MEFIQLSQNQSAVLDDEDFERLSMYHWCYRGERGGNQGYAIRHEKVGTKYKTIYMHREILNPEPGFEVIFLNGDRLDCRRETYALSPGKRLGAVIRQPEATVNQASRE